MTGTSATDCWFCGDNRGADTPPDGWVYDSPLWRVGHLPHTYGPTGLVMVEAVRHFLDAGDMTDDEARTFGPVLRRSVGAIRAVTGAERVYTWSSMARFPHMHAWLLPWTPDRPVGAEYLNSFNAWPCTAEEAMATARRLREVMNAG